jgi:M6 family metalloprotease-like protein
MFNNKPEKSISKVWNNSSNKFILKKDWWKDLWREKFRPKVPKVTVFQPIEDIMVGSYLILPVNLTMLTMDELGFRIPDGSKAGQISVSKENHPTSPTGNYIMLLAGYSPGTYQLEVYKKSDNSILTTINFTTTTKWAIEKHGPSIHLEGKIQHDFVTGSAWGGGGSTVQNYNITPHSGTWKICMIMVDCEEERYPAGEETTIRDQWMNEAINGVTQADGSIRSAKKYYEEMSNGTFTLQADIFGPVHLSGNFSDRINDNGSAKGSFAQDVITNIDPSVNFTDYNTIVFIFRSVLNAPAPAIPKRCWAWAWGQTFTTGEGSLSKACLIMPHDFQNHPSSGGREIHDTLCHELGHNFGMGDLYTPGVSDRNLGNWEPMAYEENLPSLSLYHLLRQGWVNDSWVKMYNFGSMAAPVDETITLHPVEAGNPPAGRFSGIEIRISDGWNYYFEYKKGMVGEINSQSLPENRRVIGTDGISGLFTPPFERPSLLFLPNDADGDGQVLSTSEDYEETDITDPAFPTDFKVTVVSEDGDKAVVRVQYGVNSKPDPSIRKWPASPTRQWQSPDIEVKNARNATDSSWFNVPWLNNDNTIVAKVKNSGTIAAPSVRVNFYIKNYNIGGAPEVLLGGTNVDIPAGATVDVNCPVVWRPPATGHYCVVVRMPLYQLPSGGSAEMTELNNEAQSNYDRFISGSSSPYSREVTYLEVGNPYPDTVARIFIIPSQTSYHYRTYLEHTWIYLNPGETKKIRMMTERIDYHELPMDLGNYQKVLAHSNEAKTHGNDIHPLREKNPISNISLMALVSEGVSDELPHQNLIPLGGVDLQVVSGLNTEFEFIELGQEQVYGRVVVTSSKTGAPAGKIIATIELDEKIEEGISMFVYQDFEMTEDGYFRGQFKEMKNHKLAVQFYYLPENGYKDCYSERKLL